MGYQVWTKDEYTGWSRQDCETLEKAQVAIMAAIKANHEPTLTQEVSFEVSIEIKEVKKVEADQSETKSDKGPGAESKSPVRRRDAKPVQELSA